MNRFIWQLEIIDDYDSTIHDNCGECYITDEPAFHEFTQPRWHAYTYASVKSAIIDGGNDQ